jgi:putative two-component system response regulator
MNNPLDFVTKKTILVVDDTSDNLSLMSGLLKDQYRVKLANSGEKALKAVQGDNPPDLILLDIMMPGMSGYEVCQVLKADPASRPIPIIFLTAMTSMEDEQKGLELGAADYITKPISPPIVMARVKTQLENKAMADFLRDQAAFLKAEVERQTQMVRAVQDATVLAMASLAETRDSDTGNHIRRTQFYVQALANKLRTHPRFSAFLTDEMIDLLFKTAPLHDIGKVGIPDRILLKPAPPRSAQRPLPWVNASLVTRRGVVAVRGRPVGRGRIGHRLAQGSPRAGRVCFVVRQHQYQQVGRAGP